ncbi:DNA-binding response OmpR family regulator [Terracoccus luteus]|uniref:DNA-binding response OmpR family regulator n=1 Tax=Terracoccus luteus TaxID=53356 RepID=A0A495Y165_9MICO|nr:response regulator transcription factor [Terracoccus luteus]RKT79942.1 DNA-binding response OmpR family regulator [Terracoccus luteus]
MRVLLVEDEVALAQVVKRGLEGEGWVVDVEHDGESGLWAATENAYDAMVLDIMLPRLDGYRVLEQLRAHEVWTPVVMLTAKDGDFDQTDALDLGADDYLTKPFSFVVLAARLRALVRRGAPRRPAVLQMGTLRLDPATHRVDRSGTPIRLTAREFSLLHHLMRHPDQVVGKTELLDQVWDGAYEGDVNVVEVYVGYLRRKIDVPFGATTIETVRGAGYRLVAG